MIDVAHYGKPYYLFNKNYIESTADLSEISFSITTTACWMLTAHESGALSWLADDITSIRRE
jgi:hypothetical protein